MPVPVTPPVAADLVIELIDRPNKPIVLIERKHEPLGWAFPGGFVEVGESVEHAAVREAEEETGLKITLRALLGVYSDPARDPRRPTVGIAYVATASGTPRAGDDAKTAHVYDLATPPPTLVFDHAQLLADYRAFRETGRLPTPR